MGTHKRGIPWDERRRFLERYLPHRAELLVGEAPPEPRPGRIPPPEPRSDPAALHSLRLLHRLNEDYPGLVVMGGWATWLHTGARASSDVDVIAPTVSLEEMSILEPEGTVAARAHVGGIRFRLSAEDGGHADIYLPHRSRLGRVLKLPVEHLTGAVEERQGFHVLTVEALIATKMAAALDRAGTERGDKDLWDIGDLVRSAAVNWRTVAEVLSPRRAPASERLQLGRKALEWTQGLDLPRAQHADLLRRLAAGEQALGGRDLA